MRSLSLTLFYLLLLRLYIQINRLAQPRPPEELVIFDKATRPARCVTIVVI